MEGLFENEVIRALSWKQPYAEMMLHGKIETRTWNTNYRGLVLICASKKGYNFNQVYSIAGDKQILRITDVLGRNNDHWYGLHRSGIAIAVGRLIDCRPMRKEDEDKCFVEFHPDLYCHVYEDVKEIKPFDWKGSQGWKKLDEETIKKITLLHAA